MMALGLAGCASAPGAGPGTEQLVKISTVLNMVKDELNVYMGTPSMVTPNTGACLAAGARMDLLPTKVTVVLKAVSGQSNEAGGGVAAPLGVLSIDPSVSLAYSSSRTQTFTIPLVVPAPVRVQAVTAGSHPLADALISFRDEILRVDHAKTPCLKYAEKNGNFTLNLAFDVVKQGTAGLSLQLAVFKVSDKQTVTAEAHQSLEVEMALTGSGDLLSAPLKLDIPAPAPKR
jgi:hypothetical protein